MTEVVVAEVGVDIIAVVVFGSGPRNLGSDFRRESERTPVHRTPVTRQLLCIVNTAGGGLPREFPSNCSLSAFN